MNDEPQQMQTAEPLADALQRLAIDLERREPPASVQHALRRRWQPAAELALAGVGPRRAAWAPWVTASLVGALLVLSTALFLRAPPLAEGGSQAAAFDVGFVPVAAAERWPAAARDGSAAAPAWLVRAELPRERLAEFGLPFDPSRAGDTVRTELLMRASGEVLAVRVLADASPR